jgi:hypothetical protein
MASQGLRQKNVAQDTRATKPRSSHGERDLDLDIPQPTLTRGERELTDYRPILGGLRGLPARPRIVHVGTAPTAGILTLAESLSVRLLVVWDDSEGIAGLRSRVEDAGKTQAVTCVHGDPLLRSVPSESFDLLVVGRDAVPLADAEGLASWSARVRAFGWLVLSPFGEDPEGDPERRERRRQEIQAEVEAAGFSVSGRSNGSGMGNGGGGDAARAPGRHFLVARKLARDRRPDEL